MPIILTSIDRYGIAHGVREIAKVPVESEEIIGKWYRRIAVLVECAIISHAGQLCGVGWLAFG
jgi:hypothetical protein